MPSNFSTSWLDTGNWNVTYGENSWVTTSVVDTYTKPAKYKKMLCVGGYFDGDWQYYRDDESTLSFFYFREGFQSEQYTKRTYKNSKGQQFSVLALESLKGHDVLTLLNTKNYKNNPLKEVSSSEP